MRVVDVTEDKKELLALCLEDWSEEAKEAGPKRRKWLDRQEKLGLRAKFALDADGVEGGMIQYGPIEHSFVDGSGLYFVYCIHVHGHKEGRGNFRGHGMGRALLYSAEEDARSRGAKGLAVWGLVLPFWMRAHWFKKQGYRNAERQGIAMLLWKPFTADAEPPRWFPKSDKRPDPIPGKVNVTALSSGWCLAQNLIYERAKRASAEFGKEAVAFKDINTSKRAKVAEWGASDVVFIDGKKLQSGPPPSYKRVRGAIARRVRAQAGAKAARPAAQATAEAKPVEVAMTGGAAKPGEADKACDAKKASDKTKE
jgi:GNAT superfamily N-acetyltransferase